MLVVDIERLESRAGFATIASRRGLAVFAVRYLFAIARERVPSGSSPCSACSLDTPPPPRDPVAHKAIQSEEDGSQILEAVLKSAPHAR
jgi:hypothetical protein